MRRESVADLGAIAAAREIVNEYVWHKPAERESLAWTIARIIERHTQIDARAARLAAVEQLLQEADITCSCCQGWVETLQAALHAGAAAPGEASDGE
jgi:hypothetical protein